MGLVDAQSFFGVKPDKEAQYFSNEFFDSREIHNGSLDVKVSFEGGGTKLKTINVLYHDEINGTITSIGYLPSDKKENYGFGLAVLREIELIDPVARGAIKGAIRQRAHKRLISSPVISLDDVRELRAEIPELSEEEKQAAINKAIGALELYLGVVKNNKIKSQLKSMVSDMYSAGVYKRQV